MKKISIVIISLLVIILISAAFKITETDNTVPIEIPKSMIYIKGNQTTGDFYLFMREVNNNEYLLYLDWLRKNLKDNSATYNQAFPDTTVFGKLFTNTYNDPMMYNYFYNPAFKYYPVVGVNWSQAMNYCIWKSSRLNEEMLWKNGLTFIDTNNITYNFSLETKYSGNSDDSLYSFINKYKESLITLRLPTEYEWDIAYKYVFDKRSKKINVSNQIYGAHENNISGNYVVETDDFNDKYKKELPADVFRNTTNVLSMDNNVSEWVYDNYNAGQSVVKLNHKDIYEEMKKTSRGYIDSEAIKKEDKLFKGGSFLVKTNKKQRGFYKSGQYSSDLGFRYVMNKPN